MRVLYCSDTYPPQVNGVSVVTALSVAGLRARGWDCGVVAPRYPAGEGSVFSGGPAGSDAILLSVPSIAFPQYPDIRLAAPAYGAIARAVRRFRPDLVHCETEFMLGRLGQLAALRAGVPVVSSYHTDFARYAEAYGVPWLRASVSRYIARFHRRSRRTYTPSAHSRDELIGIGVRDVEVWGRGVDADSFSPTRRSDALRAQLGVGNRFMFLHVGRLAPEKRAEQVADAYRVAVGRLPPDSTRLVIAGAGPREAAVRAAAPEGTIFLGYLDRVRELPTLYASADAFVFASLTETLGLVVLEAMASGLPVIAAPAGGVADHLRDGVNGLSYPPGDVGAMADAMVALASDQGRWRALADGARATAESLSWSRELDRLDASYREVCAERALGTAPGHSHETTSATAAAPITRNAATPRMLSVQRLR
jgi:phosphatidylinositol alpha 1,6-mannosyltransferase